MKKHFLLLLLFFTFITTFAQKTVTGTVTSSEDGKSIIGASVIIKGTTKGVMTDFNGNYSIQVAANQTLIFSYVGMEAQEKKVGDQSVINILLGTKEKMLKEVVVTAMGIKAEKKKLNFAVQSVNSDELTAGKSANFVNSLQGKVSGLSVTNSSGSPNSGTQILIRGISSINPGQNNEPLFVLDGIPVAGKGSAAADINPNDIESVTVLKGAAASALYGQDAANGVIMITSKKGKVGKVSVNANASLQYDVPVGLRELQSMYAPGAQGFYVDKAMGGWGPPLRPSQTIYNNIEGFLQKGLYHKYDVSMSGGSEKFQAYASINYSKNNGIVPNDYLDRKGILLKTTYQPTKTLKLMLSANITKKTSRSFSSTGMASVYRWPITDNITNYELSNGFPRHLYYNDLRKYHSPISPLFSRYNDWGETERDRDILYGSINWEPIKNFSLTGRLSYDTRNRFSDSYSVPRWDDSVVLPVVKQPQLPEGATDEQLAQYEIELGEYQDFIKKYQETAYLSDDDIENISKEQLGAYYSSAGRSKLLTASAIATYKIQLPNDFNLDLLAGTELKSSESFSLSTKGKDFMIPGIYSMENTNPALVELNDKHTTHREKRTYACFGEIRGDYKGLASLSVTGRWDWSSTMIHNPYFYPSITGGVLFSELFGIANDVLSYGKIRGNYAVVGKDTNPYAYDRFYKQFSTFPDNGYGINPGHASADRNLKPEFSHSWEVGADLRFFDSRTRFDFAYYSVVTENQIVTVRVSPASGHILQVRNEGDVRNHGLELSLSQDIIKNRNFNWVTTLNFGLNRGRVVALPENVSELTGIQYTDIYTSAALGESTTSLTGKDYLRTDDGKIIVDASGYPQIDPNKNNVIGNREPLFMAGLTNTFTYKDWSLSFLLDGRLGGDVANITERGLLSNGQSKMLETYRGRKIVVDGVTLAKDGSYVPNTTAISLDRKTLVNYFYAVSSNYIEDGSFIRLSYVTLNRDLSKYLKTSFLTGLRCSFTANNVFLLTKYTGADPTLNANTSAGGTGSAGIDNYAVPNTTGFNFSVALSF